MYLSVAFDIFTPVTDPTLESLLPSPFDISEPHDYIVVIVVETMIMLSVIVGKVVAIINSWPS